MCYKMCVCWISAWPQLLTWKARRLLIPPSQSCMKILCGPL
jgi:hypothetical protein